MSSLDLTSSVAEARDWLRAQAASGGAKCPCCGRMAQRKQRAISAGMAHAFVQFYRQYRREWGYKPSALNGFLASPRDETQLAHWGLFEKDPIRGRGWWRVTSTGEDFILGRLEVPKYAVTYAGQLLEVTGPPVSIKDCLASKFDLDELLGAT